MKNTVAKQTLTGMMLLVVALFSLLPIANIYEGGWPENYETETVSRLFSVDLLEGRINFLLFSIGVSGDYDRVIVGKDGWLFLGDQYGDGLSKGRGLTSVSEDDISRWINSMSSRQKWLTSKGIPMVFAIAPNKHSIYDEFLPEWASLQHPNSTDRLINSASQLGFRIIDMRPGLIREKQNYDHLYNKTDTHWTMLGAYFGYRMVMRELAGLTGQLRYVRIAEFAADPSRGKSCCLANMLKLQDHLAEDYDSRYRVNFEGIRGSICLAARGQTGTDPGACENVNNRRIGIPKGTIAEIVNELALNDLAVLIIKDSFGLAHGRLFNNAFSHSWHLHYTTIKNERAFKQLVEKLQPDAVIYQIVERDLYKKQFYQFAGK
tara:strand:+ start:1589 stop:2719 length:1131 start_codon:yes stop_codon:yes gene_type:complete